MPRKKTKLTGRGRMQDIQNYTKEKLGSINDYLKAKKFAKNLITDEVNHAIPLRAVSQ